MTKTDINDLADFVTESQRRIRTVTNDPEFRHALWWVEGSPQYKLLPDDAVKDLLHQLEAKRVEVLRASGALLG